MSPSSHGGNLHVERYIGSCLISQLARPGSKSNVKHGPPGHYNYPVPNMTSPAPGGFQGPPSWVGMPMISMSRQRTRKTADYEDCSLSRLAMHTQGAPLILSGRYRRNHNICNNNSNSHVSHAHHNQQNHHLNNQQQYHHQQQVHHQQHLQHQHSHNHNYFQQQNRSPQSNCTNSDLSTRDEGNNNSSKANIDTVSVVSDESSGSGNSESYIPRIIKPRKRRKKDRKPVMIINNNNNNINNCNSSTKNSNVLPATTPSPVCASQPFVNNIPTESKSLSSSNSETPDEPRLHHDFSELQEEDNTLGAPSDCQCRYCDPSGQIWDAGQLCYSLFLTPPAALRRSWSDDAPACPVPAAGVIGAGRSATKSTWRAAPIEVSSEIVTSLNGLRDLEIRFFSHKDDSDDYPTTPDIEKGSDVFLCSGALCSI